MLVRMIPAGPEVSRSQDSFVRRYGRRSAPVGEALMLQIVLWSVLRLVLYGAFHDSTAGVAQAAHVMTAGLLFDLLVGVSCLLPLLAAVSVLRLRWLGGRVARFVLFSVAGFVLTFDLFVQFFFFEEYDARYNHLALDYVMYPHEVLGNILASYNVPLFVGLAAAAAVAIGWAAASRRPPPAGPWGRRDRVRGALATVALGFALWGLWSIAPAAVVTNRVANETALNGWAELVRAFATSHLDYEAYYAMVEPGEARTRVAKLVDAPGAADGLTRHFRPRGRTAGDPLDVVIVMEESLGSIFSARFGQAVADGVTPELDRWSREGLALTSVIANGNRTVRGMEGILCSFLPLPGDSVVKRDRSENVASIARVLAAQGYLTTFFTGGYGLFDNVKVFMTANGFQEFVEQPDYPSDAFRTVWGVADEYVFDAMIARHKRARQEGRRWLGVVITGSNHKPFRIPAGRIGFPAEVGRRRAVRYADWALGRYLSQARREGLLSRTVVLVAGDHGARVYGAEEIPVTSYRVPAVFLTPDPAYRGRTIDRLASQVDLVPTLLSLAGVEYDAPFFGRDLLGLPDDGGRAFVNHNRSIGMLTDSSLVVLGLHRMRRFYERSGRGSDDFREVNGSELARQSLAVDAQAAFQTAYRLYRERRFVLPARRVP